MSKVWKVGQNEILVPQKERKHDNNDAERSNWSVKDKGQLQLRGVRAFIKRPTARKQS